MQSFWAELRTQRWDDHRYYHHSRINQSLHLLSAISFIIAYITAFADPAKSALIGWLVSMVSRQSGHFFFEPKGYDEVNRATHKYKEDIKVGYNLRRKVILHAIWALSPALLWLDPTFFGLFQPAANGSEFVRHVGEIWLVVGIGALLPRISSPPRRAASWNWKTAAQRRFGSISARAVTRNLSKIPWDATHCDA